MKAKRHTLVNALEIAAQQYEDDARVHNTPPVDAMYWSDEGRKRIVETFEQQARDVRALAEQIAQSDRIELED